jgi:hypothetical protein
LSEQGVSQDSSLLNILFLFYNANLVDVCNAPYSPATGIGFVDDATVLAVRKSTDDTCSVLRQFCSRRFICGDMHGALFAPNKCVLVHYAK